MREVPTSASRLSLLTGGAVDIAQFLQPREYESLKSSPNATYDAVRASYMIWLELNSKMPPFDNIKVRKAMNLAIPREEIIRTIYYGLADPLKAPMPYIYPMADQSFFDYGYNLEAAKKLLADAGFPSGFKTTLSYNAGDPTQEPIALLYQTSLRQIGVDIQLEKLPAGVFYENVTKRQKPVIFYLDSPWTPDPGYSTFLYFHQKSYVDYSNYANPEVDALIEVGPRHARRQCPSRDLQEGPVDPDGPGALGVHRISEIYGGPEEGPQGDDLLRLQQPALPGLLPRVRAGRVGAGRGARRARVT